MSWSESLPFVVSSPRMADSEHKDFDMSYGGRVHLAHTVLESIASMHRLSSVPIILKIENRHNNKSIYLGVQFDGTDDVVKVPKLAAELLGLEKDQERSQEHLLNMTVSDVPFAEHLTLKPLSAEFLDIDEKEAFLSRLLSAQHVCLNIGQRLIFENAGVHYEFLVTDISPNKDGCSRITDCNVALDFEPISAELQEQYKNKRIIPIPFEAQIQGSIAPCRSQDFSFTVPKSMDFNNSFPLVQFQVSENTVDMSTDDAFTKTESEQIDNVGHGTPLCTSSSFPEPLLLIALPPNRKPSLPNHVWALNKDTSTLLLSAEYTTFGKEHDMAAITKFANKQGTRTLYMSLENPTDAILSYTIMIISGKLDSLSKGPGIAIDITPPLSPRESDTKEDISDKPTDDTTLCPTCRARVPKASYTLHSATCARNNVRCKYPGCNAVLRRGKAMESHIHCEECHMVVSPETLATHMSYSHTPHTCTNPGCSISMKLKELHTHTTQDCPHRLIQCVYCKDIVKSGGPPTDPVDVFHGLSAHEAVCGSKTIVCPYCPTKKAVLMKQWTTHLFMFHPNIPIDSDEQLKRSPSIASDLVASPSLHASSPASSDEPLPIYNPNYNTAQGTRSSANEGVGATTTLVGSSESTSTTSPTNEDVEYDTANEFSCHACSYINPLSRSHCEMCSTPRVSKSEASINLGRDESTLLPSEMDIDMFPQSSSPSTDRSSPAHYPQLVPPVQPSKPSLCGNQICSRLTDTVSRLCKHCSSHIISFDDNFFPDDDTAEAFLNDMEQSTRNSLLHSIYMNQLTKGCGAPNCKNPYCLSHHRASNRVLKEDSAAISELCDALIQEAKNQKYYLCQNDNTRFIVTELPALSTKLESLFRPSGATDKKRLRSKFTGHTISTGFAHSRSDSDKDMSASSRISRAFF